jgi:RND family efflux transporter MFP subunit
MRQVQIRLLAILLLLSGSGALLAQTRIPLDAETMRRLGLVFTQLAPPAANAGIRFPASVISSPQSVSEIHALHAGILQEWLVLPGQEVASGQPLATLKSPAIMELQQQWASALTAQQSASFELDKDQQLFAAGVIARQRLLATERSKAEADFRLQTIVASLELAGVAAGELQVNRPSAELGRYTVRAPAAGIITHLAMAIGAMVESGEPLLAMTSGNLWVSAELPASLAQRMTTGQTLGLADSAASLTVRQKEGELDIQTRTVGVLAEFTTQTNFMPGQIVTLLLPAQSDGILLPADAVVHNGDETTVYVKTAEGVEARLLNLQPAGLDYLAMEGVRAGEEVVVRGAALIKGITLGLGGE